MIKKSNILLVEPSSCGKTLLARTMARLLDVPFATADATSPIHAGEKADIFCTAFRYGLKKY